MKNIDGKKRNENKTTEKSDTSVYSSFQRRNEEVLYCDFESLNGLRVCVNTNVIISESGTLLRPMHRIH